MFCLLFFKWFIFIYEKTICTNIPLAETEDIYIYIGLPMTNLVEKLTQTTKLKAVIMLVFLWKQNLFLNLKGGYITSTGGGNLSIVWQLEEERRTVWRNAQQPSD